MLTNRMKIFDSSQITKIKSSETLRFVLLLFPPFLAIHCVEQIYFVYGNVLEDFGVSLEATGWILSAYFLGVMLVRPFGGWMVENLGVRGTLTWGSALAFVGCAMLLFTRDPVLSFAGRAVSGAGFGVYTNGLFSYQAIIVPPESRTAIFAVVTSSGILPTGIITPIGEWLISRSFIMPYLAIGPILALSCWYFGVKATGGTAVKQKEQEVWGAYRDLFASRKFVFTVLTGTLMACVDSTTIIMSILASANDTFASYFFMSFAAAACVVRIPCSKLLGRLPREKCVALSGLMMSLSVLGIALWPSSESFLVGGVFFGIGIGSGWPIFHSMISAALPVSLRPKGIATALLMYDLGWFITPIIVGRLMVSFDISAAFIALSLAIGTAQLALQIFFWLPESRKGDHCGA
ncbi:hypothetical protein FACS1894216_04270 [Synergistales bacterium]|nr:hypothetical protein FACS1894216_04270 [Synergistales bacterium]